MRKDQHLSHCASPHFISILRKYKKQTNSIQLNALSAFYLFQHGRLKRYTFLTAVCNPKMAFTNTHPPTHPTHEHIFCLTKMDKMILKCPQNAPKLFFNAPGFFSICSQNNNKHFAILINWLNSNFDWNQIWTTPDFLLQPFFDNYKN